MPRFSSGKELAYQRGGFTYLFLGLDFGFPFFLRQALSFLTMAQSVGLRSSLQFEWLTKGHSGYFFDMDCYDLIT